jgi:hypothetical protein
LVRHFSRKRFGRDSNSGPYAKAGEKAGRAHPPSTQTPAAEHVSLVKLKGKKGEERAREGRQEEKRADRSKVCKRGQTKTGEGKQRQEVLGWSKREQKRAREGRQVQGQERASKGKQEEKIGDKGKRP